MRKAIVLYITITMLALNASSQTYTLNLQKYWWYRYRLVNDFMKVGPDFGESIPIEQRKVKEEGTPIQRVTYLHWGDAMQRQGDYMVLLATEYKLLSLAGLTTGRTKLEIYYAMNALDRLDRNTEEYYRHWNDPVNGNPYGVINNNIQNNLGLNPQNAGGSDVWQNDFNGHYVRDDVDETFLTKNAKHLNRKGLCEGDMATKLVSDFTGRSNAVQDMYKWLTYPNSNPRWPVEISQDQVVELIKGLSLIVYLVPSSESVTVNGQIIPIKEMAKEVLLRLVNYCSNPHTGSIGGTLGWRNWQIVNPIGRSCVYGVDGNASNQCAVGSISGANMSLGAMGVIDALGQINASWTPTQTSTINSLRGLAPWFGTGYQLQKNVVLLQGGTFPPTVDCDGDGMLFATTLATIANNWRMAGFNATRHFVLGQSFPCQNRYPQLPMIYRILHGGANPQPENPFLFQFWPMKVVQVGNQDSYLDALNSAPLCGIYNLQGKTPQYESWTWSSYDWVTEAKKRGNPEENGRFPGIDYMSIYNLYLMNNPSYAVPKFYSNPYYRENLSETYPYTKSGTVYGSVGNPTYIKYLQYLSTTSHVTPAGRVKYRSGQQIELLVGFKAEYGSNFKAFIQDYSCEGCGGLEANNSNMSGPDLGDEETDPGIVEDDGPFTIDSLEDIVPFGSYEIPEDTSVQVEPTDPLLTQDSIDMFEVIMNSGDTELINAVRHMMGYDHPGGGNTYRMTKNNTNNSNNTTNGFSPIGLAISPNPNNGTFSISLPEDDRFNVSVANVYGVLVHQTNFTGNQLKIDLGSAPPGNYTIKVTGSHSSDVSKIVIVK